MYVICEKSFFGIRKELSSTSVEQHTTAQTLHSWLLFPVILWVTVANYFGELLTLGFKVLKCNTGQ